MKSLFLGLALLVVSGTAHALEVGDHAPCVVLQHIAENSVESEHCIRDTAVDGQYAIIEFFSITCADCLQNLPSMQKLIPAVGDRATVRAVAIDRNEYAVREFIQNHQGSLNYEIALDLDRMATRAYDVLWVPTLFILDANKNVVYKHTDVLSDQDITEIQSLVQNRR